MTPRDVSSYQVPNNFIQVGFHDQSPLLSHFGYYFMIVHGPACLIKDDGQVLLDLCVAAPRSLPCRPPANVLYRQVLEGVDDKSSLEEVLRALLGVLLPVVVDLPGVSLLGGEQVQEGGLRGVLEVEHRGVGTVTEGMQGQQRDLLGNVF